MKQLKGLHLFIIFNSKQYIKKRFLNVFWTFIKNVVSYKKLQVNEKVKIINIYIL